MSYETNIDTFCNMQKRRFYQKVLTLQRKKQ